MDYFLIKNLPRAFNGLFPTPFADVPENPFMANQILSWTILDNCPRVKGINFTDVPDDDTTLDFLIKLENVDYPELIWEDLAYQIDHRKKRSRHENMPFPRFTKFVKIGEDYQEYGLLILETMLTEAIKQSESYQMFIKYSTESEPEPVKRKTSSKRRVKKKVTLSADDNIISDDPDTALELGKSISKIEAEEAEATRQVHATHARIVTESVLEPTKRRKSGKVTSDPPKKLKGTGGSSEGTGTIPRVPDESTVVSTTSSERTSAKPGVPDEEKDITEENVILEWGSGQESKYSKEDKLDDEENDDKEGDADDEDDETESDEDDIYKYKIRVRKDEDEEMLNAEVKDSDKGNEEVTDAAKVDAEKTLEVKDDAKKIELPPTSSSLSVSSGFDDQFLKLFSDSYLVSIVKDTTYAEINSLLEVKIQSKVPHNQSLSMLSVPVSVIFEPSVLTLIRVAKLEKDVSELKKIDLYAEALTALKIQVPSVIDNYLGSKVGDVFQKELKKHEADLIQKYSLQQILELPKKRTPIVDLEQESEKTPLEILKIKNEQAEKQKMPKFTIKSTDKEALKEYDQKSALYQTIHANKSFNRNPANHRLYHALMEALIEDKNAMDKGVAHTESESSKKPSTTKETPKGKAPSKGSKTGKSASAKEPVKEPIAKVVMDDTGNDMVHDDDQPQDASEPKTTKTLNPDWFTQPPRSPTPDPEWNKRQDPLTFDDLMATPIDFSKYVLNRLKIDNLTQDILLGLAYNLLKGTCSSGIKLEYHFQECFNALTDMLDWNNSEGDCYPFDLSKPLPLQGHPGRLTVAADYFFNNDLEYMKSSDPERTYTTSITKTKAAQYEIEGIEHMVPTLWSPTKVGSQLNKFSKHNMYSIKKILGVKSVSVKKLHGYGHLEEIVVKRANYQLYKFKEGDFVDLHLNDIEDMLLLAIQHKLFNLTDSDIVDFIVALCMFIRSLVIKKRVEDLQLGVESFGDQFLKLSSDSSLVSTVKDTTNAEINSLLEPLVLTPLQESSSIATVTNLPPPYLRVAKLEKDVSKLKKIDLSTEALASLKTQVPSVVDNYLGSKVRRKHDDDVNDDDEDPLAGPNQGKKTKRRITKESESSKKPSTTKETPKGKAPSKGSKTGKSASAKEPVEEPIAEVVMDDAGDDVSVSVKKLHGYGHMEEIVVKRADRQFYKFKEGDFVDLHLNDIKDMLLLTVQHKLFHLTNSDNVGFSYVHKKSHHQETCRGLIAWCRELSEESQHHSTSTDLSKNRTQRTLHPISLTAKDPSAKLLPPSLLNSLNISTAHVREHFNGFNSQNPKGPYPEDIP
ncbi:hypothetical protein Tco_0426308 [Tanacetum coccineum]